jgi:hypothetical protein
VDQAEVVDPDRRFLGGLYLVGALVGDLDAHIFQERHDLGERDLLPEPVQPEAQKILGGFERVVEAHP